MGRQESLLQIKGGVANLSFYKSKLDGYLVRKKSGVTRERIMTDPAYARTRENIAEFATGGRATKLLRLAFRTELAFAGDSRITGRMASVFMKVIKEDAIHNRGERTITPDEITRLEGFEFNINAPLDKTFHAPYTAAIDRATGTLMVNIDAFSPKIMVLAPEGATHFRFRTAAAALNFDQHKHSVATAETENLDIKRKTLGPFQLTQTLTPASADPLILALGIEFVQIAKDKQTPMNTLSFNAMSIVKVDGGAIAQTKN